jgi:hypothetical protein
MKIGRKQERRPMKEFSQKISKMLNEVNKNYQRIPFYTRQKI